VGFDVAAERNQHKDTTLKTKDIVLMRYSWEDKKKT